MTNTVAYPSTSSAHVPQRDLPLQSPTHVHGATGLQPGHGSFASLTSRNGSLEYSYHHRGQEQLAVPNGLCLSELSHDSNELAFYPGKEDVYR